MARRSIGWARNLSIRERAETENEKERQFDSTDISDINRSACGRRLPQTYEILFYELQ